MFGGFTVTDRGLIVFGILILLSIIVLGGVLFALPSSWTDVPVIAGDQQRQPDPTRTPKTEPRRPPNLFSLPLGGPGYPPGAFGIRPFGLHRGGLEGLGWYATAFGVLLICSAAALFVFARQLRSVRNVLCREPRRLGWFFLLGLVGYALMALLFLLVYLNYTTSALLLVITPAGLLATVMGVTVVEMFVGRLVAQWASLEQSSPLTELLIGVILLFLASCIPYAGWFLVAVAGAAGFGSLLYTRFGEGDDWSAGASEY
jgi:hypothetical protein